MARKLIYLIIFLLVGSVNFSCEKIIDPKLDEEDPLIVVNGLLSPDSSVKVNVSQSLSILDDEYEEDPPYLNNASVNLFEDGTWLFSLDHAENGNYIKDDFFPGANKSYRIEVQSGELADVYSTTSIPSPVPVNSLDTSIQIVYYDDFYFDQQLEFSLKYDDPPDETNYYLLEVYMVYVDEYDSYFEKIYFDVPEIDQEKYDITGEYLLWSDLLNDGEEVEVKGWVYYYPVGEVEPPGYEMELKMIVVFKSLNRDYYLYKKSFYNAQWTGSGNPFAEPVQVYSNIENGIGILGAFSAESFTIDLINSNLLKDE